MSSLALKPRASEKTYSLSQTGNTYAFVVPKDVNKHAIAEAVEAQFSVSVVSVRIASTPGKSKRAYRKRGRYIKTLTSGVRKAYVTLKDGDSLPIFDAVEEGSSKKKESK